MGVIKIIWKTEIWKLFENWSFENYLTIEVMKIKSRNWSFENYLKIEVLKIKFGNWSFENYLKIRVLKIICRLKFWWLNLEIEVLKVRILKIKFRNWSFENWNFEELFENVIS